MCVQFLADAEVRKLQGLSVGSGVAAFVPLWGHLCAEVWELAARRTELAAPGDCVSALPSVEVRVASSSGRRDFGGRADSGNPSATALAPGVRVTCPGIRAWADERYQPAARGSPVPPEPPFFAKPEQERLPVGTEPPRPNFY